MVKLRGKSVELFEKQPGEAIEDILLTTTDLKDVCLSEFSGYKLLSIVPSLDTQVCLVSTKRLNDAAKANQNLSIFIISKDLPFAQKRILDEHHLSHVKALSAMRSGFGQKLGLEIKTGPLKGLLTRALIVLDRQNKLKHFEIVDEITNEPDYSKAFQALNVL